MLKIRKLNELNTLNDNTKIEVPKDVETLNKEEEISDTDMVELNSISSAKDNQIKVLEVEIVTLKTEKANLIGKVERFKRIMVNTVDEIKMLIEKKLN